MVQRTLITGGAGFIGSHLCDHFLNMGHEVICVDNLITGNEDNIRHLSGLREFDFWREEVADPELQTYFITTNLDNVLHFASPTGPRSYDKFSLQTLQAGSEGTNNMLELAYSKGARFLLASSSEIYGDPWVHPQLESYNGSVSTINERAVYCETKRFAETLTMAYHRKFGTNVRIARMFNTYGPRMSLNDGRVEPNFVIAALKGEDLKVYGDGKQTRTFCYVSDMVDGISKLLNSDYCEGEPVNLGSSKEMWIETFARLVINIVCSKSEIVKMPDYMPPGDASKRKPDLYKAEKLLGWSPKVGLREGLIKMVEDFRKRLGK